jgi:hypothetical protein
MSLSITNILSHDAVLKSIYIDRSNAGKQDILRVDVESSDSTRYTIDFTDCYAFKSEMYFGIQADEAVGYVECITASDELRELRQKWLQIGVELGALKCFLIKTTSTGSTLKIFCMGYSIVAKV